jgi:purine catabolism regulator
MTSHELQLRAQGLGVPLGGRCLVGAVMRPVERATSPMVDQAQVRRLAAAAADGIRAIRAEGLVGVLDESTVGLVLAADDGARLDEQLTALAGRARRALADETDVVVAAGSLVTDVLDVRRSFLEATQVADVAPPGTGSGVHRLTDVGLDGLLHLFADDERLQTYVERELGALLSFVSVDSVPEGARRGRAPSLLAVLRTYLDSGRNKSVTASECGLSRPALYERLRSIEALLDVDLDDVRTCLSLHVAVRAHDLSRRASD